MSTIGELGKESVVYLNNAKYYEVIKLDHG